MNDVGILTALGDCASIEAEIEKLEPMDAGDFEPAGEGDFLAFGPTGHGLMSWFFRLRLRTPALDFDFTLPCLQALADEETRQAHAKDLKTVCQLVAAAIRITEGDRSGAWRVIASSNPGQGCAWRLAHAQGERSGKGWASLVDVFVGFSDGLPNSPESRIYG